MTPRDGDVLVSNSTAAVEHRVSIVADSTVETCKNDHDVALTKARELAKDRHVDVWRTEDHTHFLKVAFYRRGDGRSGP
jgi:hypothetical protein